MPTTENAAAYNRASTPTPWLPLKGDIERDATRVRGDLQRRINGLRDLAGEAVAGPLFAALIESDNVAALAHASWTQAVDERDQLRRDAEAHHSTSRELGTALAAVTAERDVLHEGVEGVAGSSTARLSKSQAQALLRDAVGARARVYDEDQVPAPLPLRSDFDFRAVSGR